MPAVPTQSPRLAAARLLSRQFEAFPRLHITVPDVAGMTDRDAALAFAIVDAATSRWLTLEHILSRYVRGDFRALEPRLAAILIAGATQLLLLDRIPAHAALNEAVELAKGHVRPGAGALVNAVLRRVAMLAGDRPVRSAWSDAADELLLPDGRAIGLAEPVWPADEGERLAITTSHPGPLLAAIAPERRRAFALHSLVTPPTLIFTAHDADPADSLLAAHDRPTHAVFTGSRPELVRYLDAHPRSWVQDPASTDPIREIAGLRPARIFDLCAGQGTKTRQLAATFPEASIIATDVHDARRATLKAALAGVPHVRAVDPGRLAGLADLILLDVPCSNTGVLARRREAKYRVSAGDIAALVRTQRSIVERSLAFLAPGGRILYSTCSVLPEENGSVARWAVEGLGLRLEREGCTFPAGLPGEPPSRYHDGGYFALLAR